MHRNTIEFTKDSSLSKEGDCIVGVNADFDYPKLMDFVSKNKGKKIKGEISVGDVTDSFTFVLNGNFDDKHEIVLRRSEFHSERTLGFKLDKAAVDLDRKLVERAKNKKAEIKVVFRT
jgi:hypothetical protein